jgi:hypothetical protein
MSTVADVWTAVMQFATEKHCWILPSGLYDMFPKLNRSTSISIASHWPNKWPGCEYHGVYLFFSDSGDPPELLYVGRAQGKSVSIGTRLNGYVDMNEYRAERACKLRDTWGERHSPWGTPPRYVMTVALETDMATNDCPLAKSLEAFLVNRLDPPENIQRPRLSC